MLLGGCFVFVGLMQGDFGALQPVRSNIPFPAILPGFALKKLKRFLKVAVFVSVDNFTEYAHALFKC